MFRRPRPCRGSWWTAIVIVVACGGLWLTPAVGQEPSAEQLQRWLRRFPEADANKDGKLTAEEAAAFRRQRRAQSRRQPENPAAKRPRPTHANVAYGPHQRNVLDFYQAESDSPTPLVVYIHGGGFVQGSKESIRADAIEFLLANKVSVAALNYRFVDGVETIFPVPQHDCARAIQFLRSQAKEWNIDPTRLACYGGSAGAGISMWLAFHEDLADPNSDDPIARKSTRLTAVGTIGGQAMYDPVRIKELVGGRAWEHPSVFKIYGNQSVEEALNPSAEKQALYDETSAITHLTADDPPLFMVYSEPDKPLSENAKVGQGIHHPRFGHLLKKRMDELDIENVYVHTSDPDAGDPNRRMMEFFLRHFGMTAKN